MFWYDDVIEEWKSFHFKQYFSIVRWFTYSVFKKEGVKVKGYYTAKKWILGPV